MIQLLSGKYKHRITWTLFVLFYLQLVCPVYAASLRNVPGVSMYGNTPTGVNKTFNNIAASHPAGTPKVMGVKKKISGDKIKLAITHKYSPLKMAHQAMIGGPSSPEASSFKAIGSNNLVNLFTGDFSYSIPLLDVGGYPVNLFYNGGITMDQEASWVGLGWNINPGSISRNMRGVPDDFNGTDSLIQEQNVKPNRTWGGEIGADGELIGLKIPQVKLSLGFSYNNYLGPAIDFGASTSISIATIQNISFAKAANMGAGLSLNVGAKLSSRSGFTLSPSLNAGLDLKELRVSQGVGLSTSYNSRTGIKDVTLNSQTTVNLKNASINIGLSATGSSSFSFARPSYLPVIRFPMENSNTSGQIELGGGIFGFRGSVTGTGYYSESRVAPESRSIKKPLVGFMFSQNALINKNAVMDFTRLNDAEVTPSTPMISAPQYAYDIFSIQGEGTGGAIRAYRGDLGFMRDNVTTSKDKNISLGIDFAPPGHYGGNWTTISSPTRVGGWEDGNNTLLQSMPFQGPSLSGSQFENVYFKNPGETTVASDEEISRIGADNLVRFQLSGTDPSPSPRLESVLETFNKRTGLQKNNLSLSGHTILQNRQKRTQVTTMLTAFEASQVGLEKTLRSYRGTFDSSNTILYDSMQRVGSYRKPHHISEINVLEQNGMRYVYGIPVYSVRQKDFTFSVGNTPVDTLNNLVAYDTTKEAKTNSDYMTNSSKIDGYVQTQETPGYASSFLLTGLLSPDYVDVTGDGITEDDLGGAVKFDYTKSTDLHKWRTPRKNTAAGMQDIAHYNEGIRTERRDNKATISYGEREAWYLNSIESKSMVAIFKTDVRNDAKGVNSPLDGTINKSENANKRLTEIDLYTKAEIKSKGISLAIPLKSVFFEYDYQLTNGSPDNATGGKLSLNALYFTYNGQLRNNKSRYVFNYRDSTHTSYVDNPTYKYIAADRWGTYKDTAVVNNPSLLSNINYPYTDSSKVLDDGYAGAWSLKKILLPSGGQMQIQYEADDYGYVQDRRACNMWMLYGLGNSASYISNNTMYTPGTTTDNYYVYIKLPNSLVNTDPVKSKREIFNKYLAGINQLAFKLLINMPGGPEPLTVYANYDDYGLCPNTGNSTIIYLLLRPVNGNSPLANSAIGFLTGNLPAQAFDSYNVDITSIGDFLKMAVDALVSVTTAFQNVDQQMRSANKARSIILARSFVRMNNPLRVKYGGGARVKRITLQDNWNKMSQQYNSTYGQDYDYTITEKVDGVDMTISSGVASYEPGIGSEENPFREIATFQNVLPLASAIYGAIEMPMLEGLYPAPCVGYSQVTVRSIHRKGTHGDSTVRSAIGKQVTQFYTARDFPTFSTNTSMKSMDYNKKPFFSFFSKEIINRRTISQGFLVETNDMHGKMKFQAAYSESDEKTPISASYHSYKNTGKNGVNDQVNFVYNDQGGIVKKGSMGIDVELMTDVREFKVESNSFNGQVQIDLFPIILPFSLFTLMPLKTYQQNIYRAVTCTKLINYHAIEDSVVVMDKGSIVSTKTIAYDSETGSPIVSQTANEFNDSVYNINYPAYWAYSSTGLAYKNIGLSFTGVNFLNGKIVNGADTTLFESGDELYIAAQGTAQAGTCSASLASGNLFKLWAFDQNKNITALTVPVKNLLFMDSVGNPFTGTGVNFRILRSGKRNNLGLSAGSAVCMNNPLQNGKLVVNNSDNIVSASATEYREKWQVDRDVILRKIYATPPCSVTESETVDCSGILEKKINPYVKGLIGNLKPNRSYTYYGSRNDSDVTIATAIRKNGYINNFSNYWGFNASNNLVPDYTNAKWVWNSELTKVNSKGQELETRDALNRYTAAQYGFNKNMPVALVQNARSGESFNEGFEDFNYAETINNAVLKSCDNNKYVSFVGLANSSIINTDTTSIKSHTGKYALLVNKSSQTIKPLPVKTSFVDYFNFNFLVDTTKVLNQPGGNITSVIINPNFSGLSNDSATNYGYLKARGLFSNGGYTSGTIMTDNTQTPQGSNTLWNHNFSYTISYYILVGGTGNSYSFNIPASSYNTLTTDQSTLQISISAMTGTFKTTSYLSNQGHSDAVTYNYSLCPGIYFITVDISNQFSTTTSSSVTQYSTTNSYSITANPAITNYQTLSTVNGCVFTKPMPATDSMLNQTFAIIPGSRMQFSAWVKEASDSLVNYRPSYIKNHIELQFPGSSALSVKIYPSGSIIEGWQKIEGEFIVPLNATTANLVLSNDSTQNVYYDDIRIHPFNANMKSYVYDPRTLKLSAELDENNYASLYEYDEEGQLVRVKKETIQGIKTIKETRNSKQKSVTGLQ